ncbi:MAG TPA: YwbE family protein [Chloroflexota bacterium]|nr:YwbE family protein [Chloroflexota bacterium]
MSSGQQRRDVRVGVRVRIVEKHNQQTGTTTEGIVRQLLTKSATHPHGIKVRLETGQVGRVKEILT